MSESLQCCTQVMNEKSTRAASSAEASTSRHEPDRDKLVPAKDLADAKKRMLATLKKKQAEYAKRVGLPGLSTSLANVLQSSQHDRQASICAASTLISYHRYLIRLLA